ncbi:hypothetical protein ALC62_05038 [Cyphomyrmex costatus]|uniref:Uncharacterized protein n=1 Tax=Cyphomyrmex costatus TaxID=456900 RepID=A0A195CUS5_9HYME|nr:hypothetical protein ALC62_05038 [Cyphomyrmex costatus]
MGVITGVYAHVYVYHERAPASRVLQGLEIGGERSGGEGGGGRRPADGRRGPRRGKLRILRVPTARVHLPSPLCHPVQPRRGYIRTGLLVLRYHSLTSLSLQSDLLESTILRFQVLPHSAALTGPDGYGIRARTHIQRHRAHDLSGRTRSEEGQREKKLRGRGGRGITIRRSSTSMEAAAAMEEATPYRWNKDDSFILP